MKMILITSKLVCVDVDVVCLECFNDDLILFYSLGSALARSIVEDAYLTMLDVDGQEAADLLRMRMNEKKDMSSPRFPSERSHLLGG